MRFVDLNVVTVDQPAKVTSACYLVHLGAELHLLRLEALGEDLDFLLLQFNLCLEALCVPFAFLTQDLPLVFRVG
mgnify:CR=1 FL=1